MASYYTPRSDEQLKQIAKDEYSSYYNTLRQTAQQQTDRQALALEQQKEGLQASYDKQRKASDKSYRQAYSNAGNEILRRGMQRSSYGAQRLANVEQQGIEANQDLWTQQRTAEGNVDQQIAQLKGQLADALANYNASEASDIMKRLHELQGEEYDRRREAEQYADNVRFQQLNYDLQKAQFDESVRQWQTQWDAEQAEKAAAAEAAAAAAAASRGGSSYTPPKNTTNNPGSTPGASGLLTQDQFLQNLKSTSQLINTDNKRKVGGASYAFD